MRGTAKGYRCAPVAFTCTPGGLSAIWLGLRRTQKAIRPAQKHRRRSPEPAPAGIGSRNGVTVCENCMSKGGLGKIGQPLHIITSVYHPQMHTILNHNKGGNTVHNEHVPQPTAPAGYVLQPPMQHSNVSTPAMGRRHVFDKCKCI